MRIDEIANKKEGFQVVADEYDGYDPFMNEAHNGGCSCNGIHSLEEQVGPGDTSQVFSVGGIKVAIMGGGQVSLNGRPITPGVGTVPGVLPRTVIKPGTVPSAPRTVSKPGTVPSAPRTVSKPRDVEIKRDGSTRLVYLGPVSQSVKSSMESTLAATKNILSRNGLAWLMYANIYVKDDAKRAGTYFPAVDEVWLSPLSDINWATKTFVHEFGHRFHMGPGHRPNDSIDLALKSHYNYCYSKYGNAFPSAYSRQNHREFWAESFAYSLINWPINAWNKEWTMNTIRKYNR